MSLKEKKIVQKLSKRAINILKRKTAKGSISQELYLRKTEDIKKTESNYLKGVIALKDYNQVVDGIVAQQNPSRELARAKKLFQEYAAGGLLNQEEIISRIKKIQKIDEKFILGKITAGERNQEIFRLIDRKLIENRG